LGIVSLVLEIIWADFPGGGFEPSDFVVNGIVDSNSDSATTGRGISRIMAIAEIHRCLAPDYNLADLQLGFVYLWGR
jgi:hypothetical protein